MSLNRWLRQAVLGPVALVLAAAATAQTPVARFIYEDAEAAFAQGDYTLSLVRLKEAEQAFGKANPPILYLRIQARYALLQSLGQGGVDFDLLDPLRADARRYLNDYGAMEVLVDQVREVYQISRALEQYPVDRRAWEAQLAAGQRAAEQARAAAEASRAAERARLSEPGRVFRDCPECPEMMIVPGGTLTVQAVDGQRQIEIRPFAISRYELTWQEWFAWKGEPLPNIHQRCPTCPVEDRLFSPHGPVTGMGTAGRDIWWFLIALGSKTGQSYHLPSETQWEWACRGGEQHRYCGGDELEEVGWFKKGFTGVQPVGTKKPNGYGLYDMSGNAYDGTADSWFREYDPPVDGGPRFAADLKNNRIVTRGGRALMGNAAHFEVPVRGNQGAGIRVARPLQSGSLGMAIETAPGGAARVTEVQPGSGAEQAGIRIGDVIVQIDGRSILTQWSLIAYIATVEAGRSVQLELERAGQRVTFDARLLAAGQ